MNDKSDRERIIGIRVCLNTTDFPFADRQEPGAFVRTVVDFKIHEDYRECCPYKVCVNIYAYLYFFLRNCM